MVISKMCVGSAEDKNTSFAARANPHYHPLRIFATWRLSVKNILSPPDPSRKDAKAQSFAKNPNTFGHKILPAFAATTPRVI
jgi:hypothetical protein